MWSKCHRYYDGHDPTSNRRQSGQDGARSIQVEVCRRRWLLVGCIQERKERTRVALGLCLPADTLPTKKKQFSSRRNNLSTTTVGGVASMMPTGRSWLRAVRKGRLFFHVVRRTEKNPWIFVSERGVGRCWPMMWGQLFYGLQAGSLGRWSLFWFSGIREIR